MTTAKPTTVDEYIASFPDDVQSILNQVREIIYKREPDTKEAISYGIPAFRCNNQIFIFFAAYQKHISIYPAPRENEAFKEELSLYKGGKGTVQFPLHKPIPFSLIERIVAFRKEECMKSKAIAK